MKKVKNIVLICFLVIGIVATAAVSGFFVGNVVAFALKRKTNYNFDVKAYTETIDDIKYIKADSPEKRNASEAFIIANHKLNQKDYYKIGGTGIVETGFGKLGSLKLWGDAEKEDGQIHTSIVAWNKIIDKYQVGLRYDYDIENAAIDFYYGKTHSDGSADWGEPEKISVADYIKEWGFEPTNFFAYTISSHTAIKNGKATAHYEDDEKLYTFSMSLDPKYAVGNYATQLKKMSQLNNYPQFLFCDFDFVVDKDFTLRSVKIHESYTVFIFGVNVTCDANLAYTFEYSK